ncbi:MAG: hypothetical protein QM611_05705 [Microbacterium sp.]|uniref:hypothetical protein n=1 Tax=Microbacterium sp. TaxID=51671 RepID=UPI0039E3553A
MPDRLRFCDDETAVDALTFARRASRLAEDAVRLQATGGVLAMTAAALAPRGLGDATPTVLGMRAVAADPELVCDIVVVASALEADPHDARQLVLPATGLAPAWAGLAPPRGGWAEREAVDAATLAAKAQGGMARVASALPADPGEDVVRAVRAGVWGEPEPEFDGLPLGVAFAAVALGFISGSEAARAFTSGRWTRLTLRRGHVLVRGPVASGLTPVRATGGGLSR